MQEVLEAIDTEVLSARPSSLGDAIGVEEDGVAALQLDLGDLGYATGLDVAEPEREARPAGQLHDDRAPADEERQRMPGVQPAKHAVLRVELSELTGGVVGGPDLVPDDRIHGGGGRDEISAFATLVAVRPQREHRDDRRAEVVTAGVQNGKGET